MPERGTPEYVEWMCRTELIVFGYAAVKTIAKARKLTGGTMPCPLCQEPLSFAIAPNGHGRAQCSKAECISVIE